MTMPAEVRERSDRAALEARRIRRPIILLGAPRSGTTLLGRIFSQHEHVAYWVEPRPIWMYGHAYRSHDELGRGDLTPRIARHIDRRFDEFLRAAGGARFAEKTPSNCLRIPFIHELYPDCRMINIIRDGRQVVRSTLQIVRAPPDKGIFTERLRLTPLWEWPAYVPMFFRTVWRTKVLRKPATYWGPRPRAWRQWLSLPPHVIAARQWCALMRATLREGRALPPVNYLEVRHEDLLHDPIAETKRMLEFVQLPLSKRMLAFVRSHVDPSQAERWKSTLTAAQEREIDAEMEPLLRELSYLT